MTMATPPDFVECLQAAAALAPLVIDSPHSGSYYPPDFHFACPTHWLRQLEDSHVDALFAFAPRLGIPLLRAHFPRSYCDVNRGEDDIDPHLLADAYPTPINPTEKSRLGAGLVHRLCRPGVPIYAAPLLSKEIQSRIARCWRPYHAALSETLMETRREQARILHLNVHSMASVNGHGAGSLPRPDMVLGDRDGTTCAPEILQAALQTLRALGLTVAVNTPYRGAEIVKRHSDPARGIHSLQIEINRKLYMDEESLAPHPGFARLAALLQEWLRRLMPHVLANQKTLPLAAEE